MKRNDHTRSPWFLMLTLALLGIVMAAYPALASSGDKEKLIMATNAEFPPYEYYEGSEIVGIDVEIATLIAEKMGPHFAVGDTCYSWSEDVRVYNPNGKEIIAKDNSVSILRKEDVSKAYYQCHTDITIPYEELARIAVITRGGKEIVLLSEGRFVLPGTEILNEPLKNQDK